MASETLIRTALQLAKQLGANSSKFIGTKSNVSFLGSGPKDGMLFQQNINPESFATIGIKKVLPDIETSMAYLTGGKLNDIQANKLIDNMSIMADMMDPLAAKNVVDASSKFRGGLESLRGLGLKNFDNIKNRKIDPASYEDRGGNIIPAEFGKSGPLAESPLMSKLESRVEGMKDNVGSPFDDYRRNVLQEGGEEVTGIMRSVEKGDLPAKTGAAREFLVNSLKVGDEASSTTLSDVMSAQDMKYIFEGGGGAMGDPLVLVQKYFGPRIAEMIPNGGTTEEIAIFTKRVMNNVEDAKGFRPDEPEFDAMTATFVDNLADGGRAGYLHGGVVHPDGRRGFFKGAEADASAGLASMSPGTDTSGAFRGGGDSGNNNPPPVTIGDGGITSVVPDKNPGFFDYLRNPITSLQKYAGVYKNPQEDEEVVKSEVKNVAYPTGGNFLDPNLEEKKKADIFKEYKANGGRAGYAQGGLAKILEL